MKVGLFYSVMEVLGLLADDPRIIDGVLSLRIETGLSGYLANAFPVVYFCYYSFYYRYYYGTT